MPTMAEAGVPDVEVETWFALTAPKATPREIVRRLNAEAVKALATPDLAKRYDELAIRPAGGSPDIVVQGFPGKSVCHGGLGLSSVVLRRGHGRVAGGQHRAREPLEP